MVFTSKTAKKAGQKGGLATKAKLGANYLLKIAKRGGKATKKLWARKKSVE